jgi:potassium/hydrogen antiporter
VARSISGGRVNIIGLRLPEDAEDEPPTTRFGLLKQKLTSLWSSVAGI